MSDRKSASTPVDEPLRRQVIAGIATAVVGLAAGSVVRGSDQPNAGEPQSTGVEGLLTYLHQEIDIKATAQRIYEVLLDSKQFAACTGMPAEIDPKVGGALSMFGGLILGRNVELVPNQRVVQAWRPASWDAGVYSMVRFELKGQASTTRVVLDHTGFPEGSFRHLDAGWYTHYWEPLRKFLA
jgi:activator of HSP90 ATPase